MVKTAGLALVRRYVSDLRNLTHQVNTKLRAPASRFLSENTTAWAWDDIPKPKEAYKASAILAPPFTKMVEL